MLLKTVRLIMVIVSMGMLFPMQSHAGKIGKDCTLNGKKLYGKVKIVNNFADFKVQAVENFPDLNVQTVKSFPNQCGKWEFVENFPDFTVKLVDNFPDFKIKHVSSFPGVP